MSTPIDEFCAQEAYHWLGMESYEAVNLCRAEQHLEPDYSQCPIVEEVQDYE